MAQLDKVTIRGFKSIEKLEDFELGSLNVLIGANGAGKSNFVEFFRLLRAMVEQRLQAYARTHGPSDGWFFNGPKVTKQIEIDLVFGRNRYPFTLKPSTEGVLIGKEETEYLPGGPPRTIAADAAESSLADHKDLPGISGSQHGPAWYIHRSVSAWQVYHFHDTSMTAGMRRPAGVEQYESLAPDAGNLAPFLLHLRDEHKDRYDLLVKTIRRIAPFFKEFVLHERQGKVENEVRLRWRRKETDYVFSPGHFSDGTIRFICLATVLLQPDPPETVVLDEPELGLHPEALAVLAGLVRSASSRIQIILVTQSPVLLNEFEPEQVVTLDQVDGATRFRRLDPKALKSWLDEYTLGELWQKGNIRGGIGTSGADHE